MKKDFIVRINTDTTPELSKLLFTMQGTDNKQKDLFTSLPGASRRPDHQCEYIVTFGYLDGDILGYRKKFLSTDQQLLNCMQKLLAAGR